MGKRARQQKRRAQKRKKRRVTFGTAAATKVIPASDPARASGPDRSRRRGGSDGHRERSASAAAQRGPAAAEADVVAQVAHAIEDALVRQVEALVVAESKQAEEQSSNNKDAVVKMQKKAKEAELEDGATEEDAALAAEVVEDGVRRLREVATMATAEQCVAAVVRAEEEIKTLLFVVADGASLRQARASSRR